MDDEEEPAEEVAEEGRSEEGDAVDLSGFDNMFDKVGWCTCFVMWRCHGYVESSSLLWREGTHVCT